MHGLTIDDLKRKRLQVLADSALAIRQRVDTYQTIKRLVNDINAGILDVADYYRTASRLGSLLVQMASGGGQTIFTYFAEHIDPGRRGDVRCFRLECLDLAEQIKELEQWRAARRGLRRIK